LSVAEGEAREAVGAGERVVAEAAAAQAVGAWGAGGAVALGVVEAGLAESVLEGVAEEGDLATGGVSAAVGGAVGPEGLTAAEAVAGADAARAVGDAEALAAALVGVAGCAVLAEGGWASVCLVGRVWGEVFRGEVREDIGDEDARVLVAVVVGVVARGCLCLGGAGPEEGEEEQEGARGELHCATSR
jgi:hypothetical protein